MITLLQFPRAKTIPNFSPFCLKLETWLRITKLDYNNKFVMNPAKSPKGKLPIIKLDGKTYTDSELIIDFLKEKTGVDVDAHLSSDQLAQNYAYEILFTERLAWLVAYFRWQDENGWARTKRFLFGGIPFPMNHLVSRLVRKKTMKAIYGQGIGRHSKEELLHIAEKVIASISQILGKQSYFGGDRPATIDATAFGFLGNIMFSGLDSELRNIVTQYSNIPDYCQQMKTQYYSDLR